MNVRADLKLIERVSAELRDMLGEDFDGETFWDSLDGETDAVDLVDHLLRKALDDKALSEAAKVQAADISERARRIAARSDAQKRAILSILRATGEKKLERPLATVSRRAGGVSLKITDEAAIPSQLTVTTTSPDKAAIKKALQAGEAIPGAELVTGDETISLRTK
ncbi:siphovirus Gp157 family protein [Pseudooceanicola sp. C21-150M6]|uniref:siphovirus Gp157 family protein n=1 Tax=Pseudooceanicola sp. C21-150M6 TaxID=3434355 RepID=UPI003D7F2BF8